LNRALTQEQNQQYDSFTITQRTLGISDILKGLTYYNPQSKTLWVKGMSTQFIHSPQCQGVLTAIFNEDTDLDELRYCRDLYTENKTMLNSYDINSADQVRFAKHHIIKRTNLKDLFLPETITLNPKYL
jgi:hypothetical protein